MGLDRPKALLCIDPAYSGKTGLAYFVRGNGSFTLAAYGYLTPEEVRSSRQWWIARLIKEAGYLVIEDAHYQRNVSVTKKIVEAKCYWTVAARDAGLDPSRILEVQPQQWMALVQRGWRFGKGSKKEIETIRQYVKHRWGVNEENADALSAICLGTWAIDTEVP